ncbi:MAG: hypothetical protein R3D84_09095 [Paracoccaceae bacterium]
MTDTGVLPALALATGLCLAMSAEAEPVFAGFEGDWVLVDLRTNQTVAAPAPAPLDPAVALGARVTVGADTLDAEGLGCADWGLEGDEANTTPGRDPNLADVLLPPVEGPASGGDARIGASYRLSCEGQGVAGVFHADPRVVVVTLANDTLHAIFERPMRPGEVIRLQAALADLKFAAPSATGRLDAPTLAALREWYRYRLADSAAAIPARPAITVNLLDGLGVWDD